MELFNSHHTGGQTGLPCGPVIDGLCNCGVRGPGSITDCIVVKSNREVAGSNESGVKVRLKVLLSLCLNC